MSLFSKRHDKKRDSTSYIPVDTLDTNHDTAGSAKQEGAAAQQQKETWHTMRRLFDLSRPERGLMILSAVCMALGSAVSLAVPTHAGRIIDASLLHKNNNNDNDNNDNDNDNNSSDNSSPLRLLSSLLVLMIISSLASLLRLKWQAIVGHQVVARLRRTCYRAVLSQDAAYFDNVPTGDILSRLAADADLVQTAVTNRILDISRNVVLAVGAVGLLFYTCAPLAVVVVCILPPVAIGSKLVARHVKQRQVQAMELHAEAVAVAEQALTCMQTVQQYVGEQWEADQYNVAVNAAHAAGIVTAQQTAWFTAVMQLVMNVVLLLVLGLGGWLVQGGAISAGDLASFVMYSVLMASNVSNMSGQYMDLTKSMAAADRVFEIIDREPLIPKPRINIVDNDADLWTGRVVARKSSLKKDALENENIEQMSLVELMEMGKSRETIPSHQLWNVGRPQDVVPRSVQFRNVSFAYPSRPACKVLNGLNLRIPASQVVALVGGSGAGKSTIASLLTRLYDPQSGTITFDDHCSIQNMEPQEVRRNVGIVMQEPLLFSTTIDANIRYGCPQATDEQVREAARLAHVLEFADKFPKGLQTVVGARGTQLSGGQKQRVAVARCILKNPPVVIFDEATSALDAESEAQVQKAIDTACKGRTCIIIAHRLSTIRNANAIAVLVDGKVQEMGSFEELVGRHGAGAFRQLMEKQMLAT